MLARKRWAPGMLSSGLPRAGLFLSVVLLAAGAARACLWDSDTLAAEAKGVPETVAVITGRFDRNPPLYYEMRLRRTAAALRTDPGKLEAYDDAGVASDRLHRGSDALRWMEAKRARLDRLPASDPAAREHRYRYLANAGTFWAHRWLREGADRQRLQPLRKARDLIRAAIQLNPNAHFGRERYQLLALQWVLAPPKVKTKEAEFPNFLGLGRPGEEPEPGRKGERRFPDAVQGLSGLIVLGDAWESVDVYHALAVALQREEHSSLAYLAHLRCVELIDAKRRSLHPQAPAGSALKEWLDHHSHMIRDTAALDREYRELRREADARHRHRTEFMLARLQAGRHPDTDPGFWSGYRDPRPPALSGSSPSPAWAVAAGIAALLVLAGAGVVLWRRRGWRILRQWS